MLPFEPSVVFFVFFKKYLSVSFCALCGFNFVFLKNIFLCSFVPYVVQIPVVQSFVWSVIEGHIAGHAFAFPVLFDIFIESVQVISGDASGGIKGDVLVGGRLVVEHLFRHPGGKHQEGALDFGIFHIQVVEDPDRCRCKRHGHRKMLKLAFVKPLVLHKVLTFPRKGQQCES